MKIKDQPGEKYAMIVLIGNCETSSQSRLKMR